MYVIVEAKGKIEERGEREREAALSPALFFYHKLLLSGPKMKEEFARRWMPRVVVGVRCVEGGKAAAVVKGERAGGGQSRRHVRRVLIRARVGVRMLSVVLAPPLLSSPLRLSLSLSLRDFSNSTD